MRQWSDFRPLCTPFSKTIQANAISGVMGISLGSWWPKHSKTLESNGTRWWRSHPVCLDFHSAPSPGQKTEASQHSHTEHSFYTSLTLRLRPPLFMACWELRYSKKVLYLSYDSGQETFQAYHACSTIKMSSLVTNSSRRSKDSKLELNLGKTITWDEATVAIMRSLF